MSTESNNCTKQMRCRIGQLERCKVQGCSWKKVFASNCEEDALIKAEKASKKQKTFPLEKKPRVRPTGSIKTQSNKRQKIRKRRKIYDNHKGICYLCDKPVSFEEYTIEHVIPKSKGGTNKYVNLRPAHFDCNQKKGNKLLNEET